MKFNASVTVAFTEDIGHRAVVRLTAINGTGSPLVFDILEATGAFHHLMQVMGDARYFNAWSVALDHCDTQPLGSIELDDDHIAELTHHRVAM